MAKKQTKRQRKFQASGGVQGRLAKGVTLGGPKRRKRHSDDDHHQDRRRKQEKEVGLSMLDRSDDLVSAPNLGDMDIDTFFQQFADDDDDDADAGGADHPSMQQQQGEDEEDDNASSSSSSSSSSDDDNENNVEAKQTTTQKDDGTSNSSSSSRADSSDSDSTSDDDEEEDIEAAERRMKDEMSKMERSDPEFHEFLKENEQSLLEFGQDGDDDDEEEQAAEEPDDDDEEDALPAAADKKGQTSSSSEIHLTPKLLAKLIQGAFQQHGTKNLKKIVAAYKSACYLSDAAGADADGKHRAGESRLQYHIDSSKVFDDLMLVCLNRCHKEFEYHLLRDDDNTADQNEGDGKEAQEETNEDDQNKPIHPSKLEKATRWNDLRPIMLTFFRSTLHVLEDAKEPELLAFVLKALAKYMRFLTTFPRVAEQMLKILTALWSAPIDASENYQLVRVNAFLRIRQLALTQPFPFIEDCLKKTYLAYARRAKFGSTVSNSPALPTLTFMGNCLVELYSLDFDSSYQHAFVYIRQLALLLRTALQKKTPEAMQQVYCWQYLHCLKLWVAVLSKAVPADDGHLMKSLVFPLTEIILGTVRLQPAPVRHAPLRFHCVRLLQQLAAASQVFIPTTSLLLDCLDWKEWTLPPKKSKQRDTIRGLQLSLMIKLPKSKDEPLRTHEQLEAVASELFLLLQRELELYRYSAGFPEFAIRITSRLRQFSSKETRNSRFKAYARACLDVCDKYSQFAVSARSKLSEAPKDVKVLECLKPVDVEGMRERHQASVDKEQKALEASRSASTEKNKGEEQDNDVAEDDSDASSTEEEEKERASKKSKKRMKQQKTALSREELEKHMLGDDELMDEQDQVQEGINWSDDDE